MPAAMAARMMPTTGDDAVDAAGTRSASRPPTAEPRGARRDRTEDIGGDLPEGDGARFTAVETEGALGEGDAAWDGEADGGGVVDTRR